MTGPIYLPCRGEYNSVQIRHRFFLGNVDRADTLYLYVRFDDAFIAYLNGVEIARSGISERLIGRTIKLHEAENFELFPIANPRHILKEGENILAIEGLNQSINSSDFSLHPVLTTKKLNNPGMPVTLTPEEMLSDINDLQRRLEDQAAYLTLTKFDYARALDQLKEKVSEESNVLWFARSLQKIIAQIGDTHGEVISSLDRSNERYLPFVLADTSAGVVAINSDQKTFLSEDYPLIHTIDDQPIQSWIEIASRYVAQASPQFIRREALLQLRAIDRIRDESKTALTDFVDVTLESLDGTKKIKLQLPTSGQLLPEGRLTLSGSKTLADNIGYLRISSMQKPRVGEALSDIQALRDSNGLIIDVRDNRGGYHDLLRALYGYFIAEEAPSYVANVGAYRLSKQFTYDHLHYRHSYRLKYPEWTATERSKIKQTIANFKPEWQFPEDQFSEWHFMVIGKSKNWHQYHYNKPVAVLSNAASYSATDIFLSAFSDLPGVTLIGQPSSGASGATQQFTLSNSGIEIALSSMASFRPSGKLFDGNGIEVDIPVSANPDDFLGTSDAVLDKAIAWIKEARKSR